MTGYDGIEFGAYLKTPLTTIAQPLYEIGMTSAQLLVERIKSRLLPRGRSCCRASSWSASRPAAHPLRSQYQLHIDRTRSGIAAGSAKETHSYE